MHEMTPSALADTGRDIPAWIVCPACKHSLVDEDSFLTCQECHEVYEWKHNTLHLLAESESRFEDHPDEARDLFEEQANTYSAVHYYLPFLRNILETSGVAQSDRRLRVLFNGCGVGVDVDLANQAGFESYGIDCGHRTWIWKQRKYSQRLYVGSAKSLPFANDTFDVIITGCLFPHIGVVGDTTTLAPDGVQQRQLVAREMMRVTQPGGHMLVANPNRWCPLDLWHQGQMKNSHGLFRAHFPHERFLLSFGDYQQLFRGCQSVQTMPITGYWGFHQKARHPWKRLLVPLVREYFHLLSSRPGAWLRATALNPWLIVLARR